MDYIKIKGGKALKGEVSVSGAKNSALPIIFSSLLAEGLHTFTNIPKLKDVKLTHSLDIGYKYHDKFPTLSI